jgi:hypothetical protein
MLVPFALIVALLIADKLVAQTVPVVENPRPVWTAGKEWKVAAQPYIDIGTATGPPEYRLNTVMGVTRLSDGRIVVGNMQTSQVRFYDARGKFLGRVGSKGRGPGEFTQIMGVQPLRGDTIAVTDSRDAIELFAANGKWVGSVKRPDGPGKTILAVLPDASMLVGAWPQGRASTTARYTDSASLEIVRRDGRELPLGKFPAVMFVPFRAPLGLRWGPLLTFATGPSGFYIGFSDRWEVMQFNAERKKTRVIRRAWTPIAITVEDERVYRERFLNMSEQGRTVPPRVKQQRQEMIDKGEAARTLPAYARLLVDRAGNLWAQESVSPRLLPQNVRFWDTGDYEQQWSVFDPNGRWLGQVTTPRHFQVMEIGADYIAGLHRDDSDVEHVQLYRLEKPR